MKVVIAGGGVMGHSASFYLARRLLLQNASHEIVVVERGGDSGSTGRSAGGIRHQFSNRENVLMSMYGTEVLRDFDKDDDTAVQFVEGGYLFLTDNKDGEKVMMENHNVQRDCGADVCIMDSETLQTNFANMYFDHSDVGSFGRSGEGWLDPHLLQSAFQKRAKALGVQTVKETVCAVLHDAESHQVSAVQLGSGQEIPCTHLVNAMGANAAQLMRMIDSDFRLPVHRRKRNVFYFECKDRLEPNIPMVIDSSGVYVRPEGAGYISGVSPNPQDDVDVQEDDFQVQHDMWETHIWPAVAYRVPAFEAIKQVHSWAGHYEYNTLDQNAIIGRATPWSNVFLINGFSGHGLQQAPAAGRAISELILDDEFTTIDLNRFSYERILQNKPLFEKNIV